MRYPLNGGATIVDSIFVEFVYPILNSVCNVSAKNVDKATHIAPFIQRFKCLLFSIFYLNYWGFESQLQMQLNPKQKNTAFTDRIKKRRMVSDMNLDLKHCESVILRPKPKIWSTLSFELNVGPNKTIWRLVILLVLQIFWANPACY